MNKLLVCEIFKSIQGESTFAGTVCSFVRLSGCNLRCRYCDTTYAFTEGNELSIDEIVQSVSKLKTRLVEITGGEPLIQKNTPDLCNAFLELGYTVLVETNGSCDISAVSSDCHRIIDVKCPGSGMGDSFLEKNLSVLTNKDELKYVISDRSDLDWAIKHISANNLQSYIINFSPNMHGISARTLAEWILECDAPVRLNIQLHKLIWGERRGV
ncbi:MAG TPA: radical SAM protein [Chitinispirillaceae bacterium]|nr:radical SAM protein [Chitinispirillaceae bacterium]